MTFKTAKTPRSGNTPETLLDQVLVTPVHVSRKRASASVASAGKRIASMKIPGVRAEYDLIQVNYDLDMMPFFWANEA